MCVFYYGGVGVRKDVPPKDAHASKPVLSVGLDVNVFDSQNIPSARSPSTETSDNNEVEPG